jgi:Zn-finger nucleic acid-binding protein
VVDAASLRCPHCGANAAPGAQRCPYCRGRLATVSCSSCFALMFDGARFCPSCGAHRPGKSVGAAAAKCPGCRSQMESVTLAGVTLTECPACDGVWLAASDFEHLCGAAEAQAAVLHRAAGRRPPTAARVRYRPCLACGTMMNRVNFGQISGIVVDVCRGHGTFLDAGELHAIVSFVRDGGLERARERRREELKEQERRLAQREAQAGRGFDTDPGLREEWTLRGVIEMLNLLRSG